MAASGCGRGSTATELPAGLSPSVRSNLLHLYGSLAAEVLAPAAEDPSLLEPVADGAPDLAAQVLYAATHEWARSEDDVLRRRTLLTLGGHTNARVEARVAELLGSSAARPAAVDRR